MAITSAVTGASSPSERSSRMRISVLLRERALTADMLAVFHDLGFLRPHMPGTTRKAVVVAGSRPDVLPFVSAAAASIEVAEHQMISARMSADFTLMVSHAAHQASCP